MIRDLYFISFIFSLTVKFPQKFIYDIQMTGFDSLIMIKFNLFDRNFRLKYVFFNSLHKKTLPKLFIFEPYQNVVLVISEYKRKAGSHLHKGLPQSSTTSHALPFYQTFQYCRDCFNHHHFLKYQQVLFRTFIHVLKIVESEIKVNNPFSVVMCHQLLGKVLALRHAYKHHFVAHATQLLGHFLLAHSHYPILRLETNLSLIVLTTGGIDAQVVAFVFCGQQVQIINAELLPESKQLCFGPISLDNSIYPLCYRHLNIIFSDF